MLLIFFPLIVAKKPISETLFHHYSYIAMDGHTIQHSVLSAPVHESSSGKFREILYSHCNFTKFCAHRFLATICTYFVDVH